ncbi:MAG: CRISPR-associated protein Cas4 [Bacteroidales bacterium]|nr:CRISPR-associated protein Cas4 [Bacteroidales bacterium]MCF8337295.1 CRISPR-associated protein Cas4 [Bacteroidales bacterium]
MLTPSNIIQYLYCPRFVYFEHVLKVPQNEDKSYKVQKGRTIHKYQASVNQNYLRKKIGVTGKLTEAYLSNELLRGVVDEVLWLNDGTMAPLDYKYAKYKDRVYNTYKTQMFCYAVLIEENYQKPVKNAYLVYTRSQNKLITLEVTKEDKQNVRQSAQNILDIIQSNRFPKATRYKSRCNQCTYANICIK